MQRARLYRTRFCHGVLGPGFFRCATARMTFADALKTGWKNHPVQCSKVCLGRLLLAVRAAKDFHQAYEHVPRMRAGKVAAVWLVPCFNL